MKKSGQCFAPVVDADIDTLILGSFPSVASLGKAQYYAHPQNHFWRLLGAVLHEPLAQMEYEQRLRTLLGRHIGLWDIIGTCTRRGSLDSNIRGARTNDFSRVMRIARKLRRVCFNGKTAGKREAEFSELGYETLVLPSSSPANTMRFEEKLRQWRQIAWPHRTVRAAGSKSAGLAVAASRLAPHTSHEQC